jgi:8-oxo-dGTP pyrophosphatase MutT (NUDIX family)
MKKQGFGMGRFNGFGGKVLFDEAVVNAAIRELWEEARVSVQPSALDLCAILSFYPYRCRVHVFRLVVDNVLQLPFAESDEMLPKVFAQTEIPYASMWTDDPLWLPLVLRGFRLHGTFHFGEDDTVKEWRMKGLPPIFP